MFSPSLFISSATTATTTTCFLVLVIVFLSYATLPFFQLLYRQSRSPLVNLRGPPSRSFFMGNLKDMHDAENVVHPHTETLFQRWEKEYGKVFVYQGFVGGKRLMLMDPRAVGDVLGRAYDYPKPEFVRDSLSGMVGGFKKGAEGLLTSEGDVHRRQRKILAPAFTSSHIKSLTPIFWEKAEQLRDIWLSAAERSSYSNPSTPTTPSEAKWPSENESGVRIDALSWLARATLDIIGEAGFGYSFNSLEGSGKDALAEAFGVIFSTARKFRVITILQVWFPILRGLRRNNRTMVEARATMRKIGLGLIRERQAQAAATSSKKKTDASGEEVAVEMRGRDLLSVLIRANERERAAGDGQTTEGMNEEEMLCQISTFLAAGHETTSSALTWCLYALAKDPLSQERLRKALRSVELDSLPGQQKYDAIEKCQYLDWVVRETLRMHAPVTSTMRVCMVDGGDVIPVSTPFHDKDGVLQNSVRLNKYDIISVPIQAINRDGDGEWR
ncbi:hypothetical protein VNI00_002332 [Paramarasmius palmivorus]|uniref:Cytochrome P450 n=1 Tax=Paramarasmius palmivorus TaxID=297713 RepID=A0AAW0DY03_9AGAR